VRYEPLLLRPYTGVVVDYRRALFLVSRTAMLSVVPNLIRTIIKPAPVDTACPGLALRQYSWSAPLLLP